MFPVPNVSGTNVVSVFDAAFAPVLDYSHTRPRKSPVVATNESGAQPGREGPSSGPVRINGHDHDAQSETGMQEYEAATNTSRSLAIT